MENLLCQIPSPVCWLVATKILLFQIGYQLKTFTSHPLNRKFVQTCFKGWLLLRFVMRQDQLMNAMLLRRNLCAITDDPRRSWDGPTMVKLVGGNRKLRLGVVALDFWAVFMSSESRERFQEFGLVAIFVPNCVFKSLSLSLSGLDFCCFQCSIFSWSNVNRRWEELPVSLVESILRQVWRYSWESWLVPYSPVIKALKFWIFQSLRQGKGHWSMPKKGELDFC